MHLLSAFTSASHGAIGTAEVPLQITGVKRIDFSPWGVTEAMT